VGQCGNMHPGARQTSRGWLPIAYSWYLFVSSVFKTWASNGTGPKREREREKLIQCSESKRGQDELGAAEGERSVCIAVS